jgi:hypothetical protein
VEPSGEEKPDEALRRLAEEIRVWSEEALSGPGGLDDRTLAAYIAGELDETQREGVEGRLAGSPELEEIVGVVRETLADGDWQAKAQAVKLDLRPPLLGPAPPPQRRAAPRGVRGRWWLGSAVAAAAAVLLVVGLWLPERSLPPAAPALAMQVYKCSLDGEGRITGRQPLARGQALPPKTQFQVEITRGRDESFCLLHVGPGGKVELLYDRSQRGRAAGEPGEGKLILPSPVKAFRTNGRSGLGGLILVRTDAPEQLLASARGIVEEISPPVAKGLAKSSLARTSASLAAKVRAPASRVASRAATPAAPTKAEDAALHRAVPLSPAAGSTTRRVRRDLAEDQVKELLKRLKRDHDVRGFLMIGQKRIEGEDGN